MFVFIHAGSDVISTCTFCIPTLYSLHYYRPSHILCLLTLHPPNPALHLSCSSNIGLNIFMHQEIHAVVNLFILGTSAYLIANGFQRWILISPNDCTISISPFSSANLCPFSFRFPLCWHMDFISVTDSFNLSSLPPHGNALIFNG